jgi:hypothetical protein
MSWLRVFLHRLGGLFVKSRSERELDDEIRCHLEMQIDDNLRQGMSPEEARYTALRQFGGVEQMKERYRDRRRLPLFETTLQDLRYAARILIKNPAFTAVAVLTLALGIGANTAIFSVVYGVLLQPLPYAEDEQLVTLMQSYPQKGLATWGLSQANFALYRDRNSVFEKIAAYSSAGFNLTGGVSPERLQAATVTADFSMSWGCSPAGEGPSARKKMRRKKTWFAFSATVSGSGGSAATRKSSGNRCCSTISRRKSSALCRRALAIPTVRLSCGSPSA